MSSKTSGWDDLFGRLSKVSKISWVEDVLSANANELAQNARNNAPVNDGQLRSSIVVDPPERTKDEISYTVTVNAGHGAYMEFGTGRKVSVPAEMEDLAQQIRSFPSGRNFKQGLDAIKEWTRKKGLPEEAAYPIFVSILRNGNTPQPFLYPAYVVQKQRYYTDLEDLLQRLLNSKS